MENTLVRKIILFILAALVFILGMIGIVQYVGSSQQDTWVCLFGKWYKSGNPQVPQPLTGCGD